MRCLKSQGANPVESIALQQTLSTKIPHRYSREFAKPSFSFRQRLILSQPRGALVTASARIDRDYTPRAAGALTAPNNPP